MVRLHLPVQPVASFLVVVLTTIYLCNLTIAFNRNFQLEPELDPLLSFRVWMREVQSSPDLSIEANDAVSLHDQTMNIEQNEISQSPEVEDQSMQPESNDALDTKLDEAKPSNAGAESQNLGHTKKFLEEIGHSSKALARLLEEKYNKTQPRNEEFWEKKQRATQRRHNRAGSYLDVTPNITLPPLKERAPAFLIIGAQKSGTMALRTYLSQHPLVEVPVDVGEIHYFDKYYNENATVEENLNIYIEQFFDRDCRGNESFCIAGESTPLYLYDTKVPARVKATCPLTKLIVLLRDPVKRAISHCNMMIERHEIKDTFEMRLQRDLKWMMKTGLISNTSFTPEEEYEAFRRYQTTKEPTRWKKLPIGRGLYEMQLREWFKYFPREQFIILKSEELDVNRTATMKKVFDFLGIPHYAAKKHNTKVHTRSYSFSAANDVNNFLYDFYRPYNQRLEWLLGPEWKGVWEKPLHKSVSTH